MKKHFDPHLKRDLGKLAFLICGFAGFFSIFMINPSLTTPTLISLVFATLLSPSVTALERRGLARGWAIALIFLSMAIVLGIASIWIAQIGTDQWAEFKVRAPAYYEKTMERLQELETRFKQAYPVFKESDFTQGLLNWGRSTAEWIMNNGGALMGEMATLFFLVPLITFVILNDGRTIRKRIFDLVPNRYFESVYMVTSQITLGISDYLRAKLLEAFLVGLMTSVGLALIGSPYAFILGFVSGVTNILPYVGPLLGGIPAVLVPLLDPSFSHLLWPILIVFLVVNIIDTVLIFPVVVANLVKLHPLLLIVIVMIGQQYYGLIGMLISIPIATSLKVVIQEIYRAVYGSRRILVTLAEIRPPDPRLTTSTGQG